MFNSVKTNKVSEHINDQIRKAILEGRIKPGDRLPPERELINTFHVSKATLREAFRALEVLGFLEIRKGVSGGAFIVEVDLKKARDFFINFLHFKNLRLKDLSKVRLLLEPYAGEKAVSSITEGELERLEKLIKEGDHLLKEDLPTELQVNEIEFHRIIAGLSGNPILLFILDFIENLLADTKVILQPSRAFSVKVQKAHKRIYKALVERHREKARTEMAQHVRQVERDLLRIERQKTRYT
jgi:GntR family transcriptional regulator, transcriptional repressor for pyruvate dehydrogenase complex